MRLLLDTNIIVDIISEREGYAESLQLLRYCETKFAEGFVSVISIMDVMYILRKHKPREAGRPSLREAMQIMLIILNTAVIQKSDISGAFTGDMDDYEDAVQANCAWRIGADYIVTRNLQDFTASPVPAISPRDALEMLSGN
ncbi:DNA-binding protein [Spirochaetia bacterium]|nr:DNA-binding protein [Spirochaetia bacterium]